MSNDELADRRDVPSIVISAGDERVVSLMPYVPPQGGVGRAALCDWSAQRRRRRLRAIDGGRE